MIIRILGEGQYDVADADMERLNELDAVLQAEVKTADRRAFAATLSRLLDTVRGLGTAVPANVIVPSDLVLPGEEIDIDEVAALLGDEGLVPG